MDRKLYHSILIMYADVTNKCSIYITAEKLGLSIVAGFILFCQVAKCCTRKQHNSKFPVRLYYGVELKPYFIRL